MKRYIIPRDVFDKLNLGNMIPAGQLATSMKVTEKMNVVFKYLPKVCVSLPEDTVAELRAKGVAVEPEQKQRAMLGIPPAPDGTGTYEKSRSLWYEKAVKAHPALVKRVTF